MTALGVFRQVFLSVAILACLAAQIPVNAQEGTPESSLPENLVAFEIYPKGKILGEFFNPTVEAGDSVELVVVYANTGNVVFEGRTYAIDAFTEVNGGFAVAESGITATGVTTWLDYPEEVYTIDPGNGFERPFTLTVPEGTEPGEYITALILENASAQAVEGSENFDQIVRFAVPILITVPGPLEPAFTVADAALRSEDTSTTIEIPVTNTGNVRVRPEGNILILDITGEQVYNAPVAMGSVFARDTTLLVVLLPSTLPPGDYTIRVDLADREQSVSATGDTAVTATSPATPLPPPPVQIIAASGTPLPNADAIQFLGIGVTLENVGEPLPNAQVVVRVLKDGAPIEDYVIASSLSIASGTTEIQERYIPASGWESGTWEFTLSLEVVDPGTGVAQILLTADLPVLVVP